jgi:HK97 family phage prohead protease
VNDYQYREFEVPSESLSFREEGPRLYLEGLVVPYMTPTDIIEPRGGGFITYREQFAPTAFDRAKRAPHRVTLVYGHNDSLTERLGSAYSFRDSSEGLMGEFLLDRSRADQARDVAETSHAAMSVGFQSICPTPLTERDGELVTRVSVHLPHVALVPAGAYPDARVLAMSARGEVDDEPTEAELVEQRRQAEEAELLAWVDETVARVTPL